VAAAVIVVLAAAATAVVLVQHKQSPESKARAAVEQYLADWSNGRYAEMAPVAEQPADSFTAFHQASATGLKETSGQYDLQSVQVKGTPSATFRATLKLPNRPDYTYDGTLPLVQRGKVWHVAWTPAALHPALKAGQHLALVPVAQRFGHVLDRHGNQIGSADSQLATTVIGRAPSDAKEAGSSGLHLALADTLDGVPPAAIDVLSASGAQVTRLESLPGKPGTDVKTTLDLPLQKAAESVVSGSGKPASVLLMDTDTGAILAAAGNAAAGPRTALQGRFPPGSTFKLVTATAALQNGFTLDTPVSCPPTVNAGGVVFKNAENESFGQISFRTAFAKSCNTAFVNIAEKLPAGALAKAAAFYGCSALPGGASTPETLPIPTFTCNYPKVDAGGAEYPASAFGQAQVETSPLGMASIVAAAASGTWHPPQILPPGSPLQPKAEPRTLDPAVVASMRTLMQAVVSSGTATSISGSGVAGKTGTAEFGTDNPPKTHAWFTGYRGHYAAAVLVQDGGFGGTAAAPLAARMLQAADSG
jgi:cell division protein FtsI/penicillin-binding protein 2